MITFGQKSQKLARQRGGGEHSNPTQTWTTVSSALPGASFLEAPVGRGFPSWTTPKRAYETAQIEAEGKWRLYRARATEKSFSLLKGPPHSRPKNLPRLQSPRPGPTAQPPARLPSPRDVGPAPSLLSSPTLRPASPRPGMHRADLFLPSRPPPSGASR